MVYVQIGAEEQRQAPPLMRPAAPSRESYLGLLEAFESVLRSQKASSERISGTTSPILTDVPMTFRLRKKTLPSGMKQCCGSSLFIGSSCKPRTTGGIPARLAAACLLPFNRRPVTVVGSTKCLRGGGRCSGVSLPVDIGSGMSFPSESSCRIHLVRWRDADFRLR